MSCYRANLNSIVIYSGFPGDSVAKNLPGMQETWVQSLGWEDPLEIFTLARMKTIQKEKATYSSILAWKIPWTEEPGGIQPTWSQRVGHD